MSISYSRTQQVPKRSRLTIHGSPRDIQAFKQLCDEECRSYGEQFALWLQEKLARTQMQQERQAV